MTYERAEIEIIRVEDDIIMLSVGEGEPEIDWGDW